MRYIRGLWQSMETITTFLLRLGLLRFTIYNKTASRFPTTRSVSSAAVVRCATYVQSHMSFYYGYIFRLCLSFMFIDPFCCIPTLMQFVATFFAPRTFKTDIGRHCSNRVDYTTSLDVWNKTASCPCL